jgi:hypothetical protein
MVKGNGVEKRANPRAKVSRKLRIRPSDFYADNFEEIATSANVSKRGVYFHTTLKYYRVGMSLFVTYPFTSIDDPIKSDYFAEVVRIDELPDGKRGIAIHLRSSI